MKPIRYALMATVLLAVYVAVMLVFVVPYLWVATVAVLVYFACKQYPHYTSHGSARWASPSELEKLQGEGIIIGEIENPVSRIGGVKALFDNTLPDDKAVKKCVTSFQRKQPKQLVRLKEAVHTAVFAPTGVGKGVSICLPHLLSCRDSMVVVDFKAELFRETAEARRRMGHRSVVLDPFKVCGGTDTYNPIWWIDPKSNTALDDCNDLAAALVVRTGQEKERHWDDSAELWISAMIAAVACFADGPRKSLQTVRELLTDPVKMAAIIKVMCDSDACEGMLARKGHQLTQFKDKELASTLTTTNRHLRFLDSIAIFDNTKSGTFDPADLLTGKMTIYLVLPPEHMRAQSALLRLWIGSFLKAVVKGGLSNRKVHFVLDEAASLGHMVALEDAVDKYRGYGIRLLFLYQSLGQLRQCWPEGGDQTLLSNTSQIYFGVNDFQTAEAVSKRLGEATIIVTSGGHGSSESRQSGDEKRNYSRSSNSNWSQVGRSLLKPEEVTALDPRVAITFTPGYPPIWTCLTRFYERKPRHREIGFAKALFDTVCLFLAVGLIAVMVTAAVFDLK